jgi:hypothetical protein
MKGDLNGYVTRDDLKAFLINVLDLDQTLMPFTHHDKSSVNISKHHFDGRETEPSIIHHSTIDLLKASESEVRLESLEDHSSLSNIQKLYHDIKGDKSRVSFPVKKSMKNFFSLKLKESQQKYSKRRISRESKTSEFNKSKYYFLILRLNGQ